MTRYLDQPRDRIFLKGYGFLSFAKNKGKNIGKNISRNLSSKYSGTNIQYDNQSTTDALKTASQKPIQKVAEINGDLIGSRFADKITNVSKKSSLTI